MADHLGDLFELAQDLARLVGSPITIEDRDTVVIAYGGEHSAVDQARVETILNRQVPAKYRDAIAAAGVFERLRATDDVILVDLPEVCLTARAVVALRHDGELLGSIWAAVGGPPTPHQVEALRSAAPVIARQVLHARRVAGARGPGPRRPARTPARRRRDRGGRRPGGRPRRPARGDRDPRRGPEAAVDLAGALALHLSAVCPEAACALQGDTLFCVVGAASGRRIVTDFLTRVPGSRGVVAGVGVAVPAADLPHSRAAATDVVRALLRRGEPGRCAELPEVFADVMVDRLRGFLSTYGEASPLTRLSAYDARHETGLVEAIDGYLTASGNVLAAAAALHLHPNTIRNRLRRARESCGVDADDPATRLALMMHLQAETDAADPTPLWDCTRGRSKPWPRRHDARPRSHRELWPCAHTSLRSTSSSSAPAWSASRPPGSSSARASR